MQSRGSSSRLSGLAFRSRIWALMLSMFATMAAIYVAGRLWQDAQNRVYLIKELDRITGQGQSAISVDDTLKVIACREQQKKLSSLEMELAAARQEGFVSKHLLKTKINGTYSRKRLLVVIGVLTRFGRKNNRDAVRKAWMSTGAALQRLEEDKGVVIRFVIGRSSNRGDSLDRDIDSENSQTNDFLILDNQVEAPELISKKTKSFFAHAADTWDAEFYAKVNDDVFVNIDALGAMLGTHLEKPRVYIGCMKSGEVFSEPSHRWYEPEWWKFGDGKSYFRHASGEMFVISHALAQFISINRAILRTYAHDDVSVGSWFIGLDVKHIDEAKFCCSASWSSGLSLSLSHTHTHVSRIVKAGTIVLFSFRGDMCSCLIIDMIHSNTRKEKYLNETSINRLAKEFFDRPSNNFDIISSPSLFQLPATIRRWNVVFSQNPWFLLSLEFALCGDIPWTQSRESFVF